MRQVYDIIKKFILDIFQWFGANFKPTLGTYKWICFLMLGVGFKQA